MIYECMHNILFLAYLPYLLFQIIFQKKYRTSFLSRLGVRYPTIDVKNRTVYVIHAVSVGETHAVSKLAVRIKERDPHAYIILSSTTEMGHITAKKAVTSADKYLFFPYDFFVSVWLFFLKVRPDVVILSEGDFWYRFLKMAKKKGAIVALVNGKISEKSFQRFQRISFFTKRLFSCVDLFCVQNDVYKARYLGLGIPARKIVVTGNTKSDVEVTLMLHEDKQERKRLLGIPDDAPVIVVGSTHDPEEKMVIEQVRGVFYRQPNTTLILVPRHPERCDKIALLLDKMGLSYKRFSDTKNIQHTSIILVDVMGVLSMCYQVADVAICAGSFVSHVGGHNILEPAACKVPFIVGPYMHSQPELIEAAKKYQACIQVEIEGLSTAIETLLTDHQLRCEMIRRGELFLQSLQGAVEKTSKQIFSLIN